MGTISQTYKANEIVTRVINLETLVDGLRKQYRLVASSSNAAEVSAAAAAVSAASSASSAAAAAASAAEAAASAAEAEATVTVTTTNSTVTTLTTKAVLTYSALQVEATIVARSYDDYATWKIVGVGYRAAGSVVIDHTFVMMHLYSEGAAKWELSITGSSGNALVQVTGEEELTIVWTGTVRVVSSRNAPL